MVFYTISKFFGICRKWGRILLVFPHSGGSLEISFVQRWERSPRKKLPFMILNPQAWTAEKWVFMQKMHFPTEKFIFLHKNALSCKKNAVSCRKMHFPADHAVFWGAHGRKPQEGFRAQESRTLASFHKKRNWGISDFAEIFLKFCPGTLSGVSLY